MKELLIKKKQIKNSWAGRDKDLSVDKKFFLSFWRCILQKCQRIFIRGFYDCYRPTQARSDRFSLINGKRFYKHLSSSPNLYQLNSFIFLYGNTWIGFLEDRFFKELFFWKVNNLNQFYSIQNFRLAINLTAGTVITLSVLAALAIFVVVPQMNQQHAADARIPHTLSAAEHGPSVRHYDVRKRHFHECFVYSVCACVFLIDAHRLII